MYWPVRGKEIRTSVPITQCARGQVTGPPWLADRFSGQAYQAEEVRARLSFVTLRLRGFGGSVHLGGPLPGVDHAVDHSDGREHGNHPEHGRHFIEQGADDQKNEALRAFHEADAAGAD